MKRLALLVALLGTALAARADVPRGWLLGGPSVRHYETGIEQGPPRSAYLRSLPGAPEGSGDFATLSQGISAEAYRGKRIRLSGYLRSQDAGSAQMWMRIDGPGRNDRPLGFDNMHDRPLAGSVARRACAIVLDVPADAADIMFGFLLNGRGEVWADHLKLEIVDASVPVTGTTLPKAPVNLDFAD